MYVAKKAKLLASLGESLKNITLKEDIESLDIEVLKEHE